MAQSPSSADPSDGGNDVWSAIGHDRAPAVASPSGNAPASLILGGVFAMSLSAWAGIVPFVGPSFGFSPDGTALWTWNLIHVLGALVPGGVGLFASLGIVVTARRPTGTLAPGLLVAAGFLTLLCGAWFASVPVVWPVLVGSYFRVAAPTLTLAYWMGLAIGPGVLLAAFSTFAMGRAAQERHRIG